MVKGKLFQKRVDASKVTMRMPIPPETSSSREAPKTDLVLRRDLVLEPKEKPRHYYGQLVDIDWQPFKIALSDSAAKLACMDDHAHT